MGYAEEPKREPNRPSLFSQSGQPDSAQRNILSSLDQHERTGPNNDTKQRRTLAWLLGGMTLAAGVTAFIVQIQAVSTDAGRGALVARVPADTATAPPIAIAQPAPPTDATAATTKNDYLGQAPALAALIVNEAPEPPKAKAIDVDAAPSATRHKPATWTKTQKKRQPSKVALISGKKATSANRVLTAKGVKSVKGNKGDQKNRATSQSTRAPKTRLADVAAQSISPTRSPRVQTTDSDVALLSAIVAHESMGTSAAAPRNSPPVTRQVGVGGAKAYDRNRDIVERDFSNNTDNLLMRCKKLGGPESDLCRARICSGRWSVVPACSSPDNSASASRP